MANSNFKVGDVVLLKSGSPRMTIVENNPPGFNCRWWNEKGNKFEIQYVEPEGLMLAPDPTAGRGGFVL